MTDAEALDEAARLGWEQISPERGEFQWRGPDGELSPRWNDWTGALRWIVEKVAS